MTKQIYRTAQGKMLDMGALILQNEKTRAVGNMKVNARGDQVDEYNNVISNKNQQVHTQYEQQVSQEAYVPNVVSTNPVSGTIPSQALVGRAPVAPVTTEHLAPIKATANSVDLAEAQRLMTDPADNFDDLAALEEEFAQPEVAEQAKEGLAAAIAKSKKKGT
jgi:hypothetical protein